jgi:predicted Zn finger-like uncharacterized protein
MIVACPECKTRYNLKPQQIGAQGRTLRCASCGHSWLQQPLAEETPKTPPLPPENTLATAPAGTGRRKLPLLPLLVSSVSIVLLAGGGALWWMRTPPAPFSSNTYTPVTFDGSGTSDIHPSGLVLSEIDREVVQDGRITVLLFHGKVTNTNTVTTPVPEIRVQLLDNRGAELDFWPADVEKQQLEPKETTGWTVRFLNPPLAKIAQFKAFLGD